jgi:hypothetical protein
MIGLTINKQFLVFKDTMFDSIMNNLFIELEIDELTRENKLRFVDYFMDNYVSCLEPIFENNDLIIDEDNIDTEELNNIFIGFEEYLDYILETSNK